MLHVAIAVLLKDNYVLISKRADHIPQGGLWEFPGGKVEENETIEQALAREIKEELGIDIKSSSPLITTQFHYPEQSVFLEVRKVLDFIAHDYVFNKNSQYGLEGQLVRWVAINDLGDYSFPEANQVIINALMLPSSYLITPDSFESVPKNSSIDRIIKTHFLDKFTEKCHDYSLIQLRFPSYSKGKNKTLEFDNIIKQACLIAIENRALILLNSSMKLPDDIISLSSGLHLTSKHLYDVEFIKQFRKRFAKKQLAASCHTMDDIKQANKLKLSFIVISPVQKTGSHPEQVPLGWEQFEVLVHAAQMPVYSLGGMCKSDVSKAIDTGAQGIAAISKLWVN
jgi:8-oxo-dGTP diphosphatase